MPADGALRDFHRDLNRLDYTRRRMEHLYGEGRITLTDLHSVYEALFLRAVTGFEGFLENLFISILSREKIYPRRTAVDPRMTAQSKDALMAIILQNNKYMNWLPFEHTEKRAEIYLKEGRPFSSLVSGDKTTIKTVTTIRNAIAHKSKHAMSEFQRTVIGSANLLRNEKKPAGFLRSQVRINPTLNRFEIYATELARIASDLC